MSLAAQAELGKHRAEFTQQYIEQLRPEFAEAREKFTGAIRKTVAMGFAAALEYVGGGAKCNVFHNQTVGRSSDSANVVDASLARTFAVVTAELARPIKDAAGPRCHAAVRHVGVLMI